ncbi:MAG: HpcH/HpaI aldolase family protein [Dermatophilaceae bacterium]
MRQTPEHTWWRTSADDDGPARGLWLTFLSAYGLEAVGLATAGPGRDGEAVGAAEGLDWVGVDLQHGDLDVGDLAPLLRVARPAGLPVLARVASHDAAHLSRVLDTGVDGVIVPTVESATQAAALVQAAHPPPVGRRSIGASRATVVGAPRPLLLAMVETRAGLEAAETIAATEGVDGLFIGPNDLTLSLGAASMTAETVLAAVGTVVDTARQHGRMAGAFTGDRAFERQLPALDLIAVDTDVALLRAGLPALLGVSPHS